MGGIEIRELEAFLVLAEELHFGRAGERLYVSQSRVSQLLRALEGRIGAPLVERTSRRVRLTPLGESFIGSLRPAYDRLRATLDEARAAARAEVGGVLRIGFQGTVDDYLAQAIALFEEECPGCVLELTEIPLSDPFGPLRRQEVDCAVVLLPVREEDLVLGPVFSRQPQTLAVSVRHPFAARESVSAEELTDCRLIGVGAGGAPGPAPAYWRLAQTPDHTPELKPIPAGPLVNTLQEGLSLTAADRGAMLLCRSTADYHGRRSSITFIPVDGLPPSELGLIWHRSHVPPTALAFARAVKGVTPGP
ncbi:LysR family transcriptional regulator [Streptomyces caelestis]|uniref:DNA-binding transcriptional LysR family regulator n=1 Tax=Streptomyces caelestis TaxID=36816 RepID=A0A7W9GYM8_9ACTN|nr:LysR family transcriptional regulator [Streptomyces caelestis]MBB5792497.1 DNA-binding transcriptional LysR family regulator [Streptomyces caelestis]GGW70873.1 LysR family transcriptional regulator [Streptomyces caelestis]